MPQLRFSEDLDFSSNFTKIDVEEFKSIFFVYDFLEIKKHYTSRATTKIERLKYLGPLAQTNSLKVEVDFLQNVILPPLELDYQNGYGVKTKVRVMDIREIVAEKIRAMNDRVRYRDFYDFAMILRKLEVDIREVLDLVRRKETRKTISPKNILNNWSLARQEKNYTEELSDRDAESQLNKLRFGDIKIRK